MRSDHSAAPGGQQTNDEKNRVGEGYAAPASKLHSFKDPINQKFDGKGART